MEGAQLWTLNTVIGRPAEANSAESNTVKYARQRWNAGIFECFNFPGSCLSALCCSQCAIGQVTSIARGGNRYVCLAVACFFLVVTILDLLFMYVEAIQAQTAVEVLFWLGFIATVFLVVYARVQIRVRENLRGGVVADIFFATFCSCCSVAQILNQYAPYRGFWATYAELDEQLDAV